MITSSTVGGGPNQLLLLARELNRIHGSIGPDEDLEETIDDFEAPLI